MTRDGAPLGTSTSSSTTILDGKIVGRLARALPSRPNGYCPVASTPTSIRTVPEETTVVPTSLAVASRARCSPLHAVRRMRSSSCATGDNRRTWADMFVQWPETGHKQPLDARLPSCR